MSVLFSLKSNFSREHFHMFSVQKFIEWIRHSKYTKIAMFIIGAAGLACFLYLKKNHAEIKSDIVKIFNIIEKNIESNRKRDVHVKGTWVFQDIRIASKDLSFDLEVNNETSFLEIKITKNKTSDEALESEVTLEKNKDNNKIKLKISKINQEEVTSNLIYGVEVKNDCIVLDLEKPDVQSNKNFPGKYQYDLKTRKVKFLEMNTYKKESKKKKLNQFSQEGLHHKTFIDSAMDVLCTFNKILLDKKTTVPGSKGSRYSLNIENLL